MDGLGENLKKVMLAGVGAVAVTAEKSKELLDEMVKKGELTVEQGKVLNEELKHNIRQTMKEKVNVSLKPNSPEELQEMIGKMTPEQLADLKEAIAKMETPENRQKKIKERQNSFNEWSIIGKVWKTIKRDYIRASQTRDFPGRDSGEASTDSGGAGTDLYQAWSDCFHAFRHSSEEIL